MAAVKRMLNRRGITSASLAVALTGSSSAGQTLTPTSYAPFNAAGYTSGQGTLMVQSLGVPASQEVVLVTDFSVRPFPIVRGVDGSGVKSHPIGADVKIAWTETSVGALLGVYDAAGALVANASELQAGEGVEVDTANPARPKIGLSGTVGAARVRSPAERLYLSERFG